MEKFNINDYMYIQITKNGWKHLNKTVGDDYIKHCIESRKVEFENEVWYRLQCHDVFHLFPIKYGEQIMFNTNVMFDKQFIEHEKIIEFLDDNIEKCKNTENHYKMVAGKNHQI